MKVLKTVFSVIIIAALLLAVAVVVFWEKLLSPAQKLRYGKQFSAVEDLREQSADAPDDSQALADYVDGLALEGKALNREDADIARHFEYGGKIKRIYVTEEQLKQLNAGQLGVVQDNGRYLLVDAEMLAQAEAVFAAGVALKIDPNAPPSDDPYADPQYQVPDDLVW